MLGLVLQGENLETGHEWLDSALEVLEGRSLPKGISVEEHLRSCDVMR